jgi:3-methyl-2-oxobutanoate hydroxymethyltransferase
MSEHAITIGALRARKGSGPPIAAMTAYDASLAAVADSAGIDLLLVGDSLGMVVHGAPNTLAVTVDEVAYHVRCVARGAARPLVVADLPFASYPDPVRAFESAATLVRAGAAMVKLEGGGHVVPIVEYLVAREVPVCAHLGLTPQAVHRFGGFRVQARDEAEAARLRADAAALAAAGASLLVLECVPSGLATEVGRDVPIPTIGIGAGAGCDGQILVAQDLLGITRGKRPRFVRDFLAGRGSVEAAIAAYVAAVRDGSFPSAAESYP